MLFPFYVPKSNKTPLAQMTKKQTILALRYDQTLNLTNKSRSHLTTQPQQSSVSPYNRPQRRLDQLPAHAGYQPHP